MGKVIPFRDPQADAWAELEEILSGIAGKDAAGEPADERDNFMRCPVCGQMFDMRSLAQAAHHDQARHTPLPEN